MILIISLLSSGVIKDQLPCTEFQGKKWVEKLLRKMLIMNQWKSICLLCPGHVMISCIKSQLKCIFFISSISHQSFLFLHFSLQVRLYILKYSFLTRRFVMIDR